MYDTSRYFELFEEFLAIQNENRIMVVTVVVGNDSSKENCL